ncbi:hypothetical protein BDL97_17G005700 [Sphagnum fallax]|nr:hypothetical protein BDL97_17G005700 [Sphagnum fallax]
MAPGTQPPSEEYRALVDKAYSKFARLREFPPYGRNKWDYYFHKAFQAYSTLWKYQQENRQKLMEVGLKRWEIGEIASRIGQLYYNYYLRTSNAKFLSESFIFYEAIMSREYFKDSDKDASLANKQLRYCARFIVICLLLNRREMAHMLARQLRLLVDEYGHTYQVKFSELTLDTFRMLQALEWEPSGSLYRMRTGMTGGNRVGSSSNVGVVEEIADPSLPPNPHKYILYRPTVQHLLLVLGTACEELSTDSVVLLYVSASGMPAHTLTSSASSANLMMGSSSRNKIVSLTPSLSLNQLTINQIQSYVSTRSEESGDAEQSETSTPADSPKYVGNAALTSPGGSVTPGLWMGSKRSPGSNFLYPSDILPFTRRPLFIIIDSDNSFIFESISGEERGEPAVLLLSPSMQIDEKGTGTPTSSSHLSNTGNLFTFFLTAPFLAFCRLLGISHSSFPKGQTDPEKLLSTSFVEWGTALVTSTTISPAWARVLFDPFLRQLVLRFIFCRAVIALHAKYGGKPEFAPRCCPALPDEMLPESEVVQAMVLQLATLLGVADQFQVSASPDGDHII